MPAAKSRAAAQSCHRYCENSCHHPRDGKCQDHWPCRLGSDCADCGVRVMCKPARKNLLLPRSLLSEPGAMREMKKEELMDEWCAPSPLDSPPHSSRNARSICVCSRSDALNLPAQPEQRARLPVAAACATTSDALN